MPLPSQFFQTKTLTSSVWPQNSDNVVIQRYTKGSTSWPITTVFSGMCDVQEEGGHLAFNAAGDVVEADAKCLIDVLPLPDLMPGDYVIVNGDTGQGFLVVSVNIWTMAPVHLELALKRGPLPWVGKT